MTRVAAPPAPRPPSAAGGRVRCPACRLWCYTDLEAWYRARSGALLRFVRHYAASVHVCEASLDAEAVVQETFLDLRWSLPVVANPVGWLHKVAARAVLRAGGEQRGLAPAPLTDDLVHGRGVWWTSLTPPPDAELVLAVREVLRAIGRLPERQRRAVFLRRVAGWSNAEIGELLGCAASTAAVHAHRGSRYIIGTINAHNVQIGDHNTQVHFGDIPGDPDHPHAAWLWCPCWGGDPQWGCLCDWDDATGQYRLLNRRPAPVRASTTSRPARPSGAVGHPVPEPPDGRPGVDEGATDG